MIEVNWTLGYVVVLFLALLVFLGRVLITPVRKVLDAREAAHEAPANAARELRRQAQELRADLETRLEEAHTQAQRVSAALAEESARQRESVFGEARGQAERIMKETRANLQSTVAAARERLDADARKLADQLAKKLLETA
ncbi:ATP synthase F0 subunit B [bacterium]|nr:ATP synthase F0 subunit B [bacterium]